MDAKNFFKAYDMRGTYGADFDLDTVYRIGRVLPGVLDAKKWLIGRDCRTTSPAVRDALLAGLTAAGADATDIGLCTTPMVYFFTAEEGYDASVMITASHNPPTDNGLKVSRCGAIPVGYADGLDDVYRASCLVPRASFAPASTKHEARSTNHEARSTSHEARSTSHEARYITWQRNATDDAVFSSLRYAVDCSNGMASLLAKELFPGAEIINATLDGSFPSHSPNPLRADAREQAAALVRQKHLDCAVIFDGDADRAMFIDETGGFIQPDYLIPVVYAASQGIAEAQSVDDEARGTKHEARNIVLHDVRTSRGAIEALREMGAEPVMVPVGHVFAKRQMRERGALCGGELAGHYYFAEFHNCDSGILAARRILSQIAQAKKQGMTFSQMMEPITKRYANSGEVNFRVEDKAAAVGRVIEAVPLLGEEISHTRLDGLRYEFADGWFNIRASNTEPYLRLVAENASPSELQHWLDILRKRIMN